MVPPLPRRGETNYKKVYGSLKSSSIVNPDGLLVCVGNAFHSGLSIGLLDQKWFQYTSDLDV